MTTDTAAQPKTMTICGMSFVKPAIWPVVITAFLVGLCVFLGLWQVQRLQWKEGLIAELEQAQVESPITVEQLPEDLNALVPQNFHAVSLMGEYDYTREFHVIGRSPTEEPGYHVITPFRIAGDGRSVLVNRGWIPQHKKDQGTRGEDMRSQGNLYLNGYILVPQGGSVFLPDHDREDNIWFWQDTQRMAAELGEDMPALVIQHVNANQPEGTLPVAKRAFDVQLRNDHFGYAVMWFSIGFIGLVMFGIYHRKPREQV